MEALDFLKTEQKEIESKISANHKARMQNSRQKGEEDGKRNLPSVDDGFISPYEQELQSKYQAEIEEMFQQGSQVLEELYDKEYKPVEEELNELNEEKINTLLEQAETDKNKKLEELNLNHLDTIKDIENLPHYQVAKQRYEKSKARWDEVTSKHGRHELNINFRPYWVYILLLIFIGIAEFPLNNQVFLSFRETPLLTLIMSGVLVLTLPFLAHAAGKILKQSKEKKLYPFLFVFLILIIGSISYMTSILRANYIGELGAPETALLLDQWTFFTIGIILFLVGAIASFFAHDDSIEFSEAYKKFHNNEEIFLELQKDVSSKRETEKEYFDKTRKAIQKEYTERTDFLKNRLQYLKNRKTQITGEYNKVLSCFQGLERKLNHFCKESIYHYRDTNLTFRNNHKQPQAWAKEVPELKCNFHKYNVLNKEL
ncbi:MAG: hypothetical protein JXR31_13285 [Prolixibacteraceae bacterium]|nr:hypothetical protein [Prolixibacteraceae bacterium]MBN2775223.1 hypothetical protein [Prolixibacteraceae bacterium]